MSGLGASGEPRAPPVEEDAAAAAAARPGEPPTSASVEREGPPPANRGDADNGGPGPAKPPPADATETSALARGVAEGDASASRAADAVPEAAGKGATGPGTPTSAAAASAAQAMPAKAVASPMSATAAAAMGTTVPPLTLPPPAPEARVLGETAAQTDRTPTGGEAAGTEEGGEPTASPESPKLSDGDAPVPADPAAGDLDTEGEDEIEHEEEHKEEDKGKSVFVLTSHNRSDFTSELVLNPKLFPGVQVGDYVEIFRQERPRRKLVLQVTSLDPIRGNIQISLLKSITKNPAFQLETFQTVVVRKTDASRYLLSYVEFSFKDQYVSQGEFWRFREAMRGKSCYIGQKATECGIAASVDEMLTKGNRAVACGVVGNNTKFIFRSCSARLFWLVQMSKEMWNFTEDGELYFERFLERFVTEVFKQWTARGMTHSLTVVYFSRSYFNDKPPSNLPAVLQDYDGRYYQDLYHVVVENETRADWISLKLLLKKEFCAFPGIAGWEIPAEFYGTAASPGGSHPRGFSFDDAGASARTSQHLGSSYLRGGYSPSLSASGSPPLSPRSGPPLGATAASNASYGLPSTSQEGNCLEAINLVLNILDKHFMDRDLSRTGQAMVLVTAGAGVFEVDRWLTNITKQRMMDNAIGCDFVSLTRAPLHVAPLFVYKPSRDKHDLLDRQHPFADPSTYRVAKNVRAPHQEQHPHQHQHQHQQGMANPVSFTSAGPMRGEGSPDPLVGSLHAGIHFGHAMDGEDGDVGDERVLPVFNIPHWIHLSFPYHKRSVRPWNFDVPTNKPGASVVVAGTEERAQVHGLHGNLATEHFEPLPFNRMFDLTEPSRSSLPVALISQLFWSRLQAQAGVSSGSTDLHIHRVPSRRTMSPWYPLMHLREDEAYANVHGGDRHPPLALDEAGRASPSVEAMVPGFYRHKPEGSPTIQVPDAFSLAKEDRAADGLGRMGSGDILSRSSSLCSTSSSVAMDTDSQLLRSVSTAPLLSLPDMPAQAVVPNRSDGLPSEHADAATSHAPTVPDRLIERSVLDTATAKLRASSSMVNMRKVQSFDWTHSGHAPLHSQVNPPPLAAGQAQQADNRNDGDRTLRRADYEFGTRSPDRAKKVTAQKRAKQLLAPSNSTMLPPPALPSRDPQQAHSLTGGPSAHGREQPPTSANDSMSAGIDHGAMDASQQAGEGPEKWARRLTSNMESHLEFDSTVFQRPRKSARSTSFESLRFNNNMGNRVVGNMRSVSSMLAFSHRSGESEVRAPAKSRSGSVLSQESTGAGDENHEPHRKNQRNKPGSMDLSRRNQSFSLLSRPAQWSPSEGMAPQHKADTFGSPDPFMERDGAASTPSTSSSPKRVSGTSPTRTLGTSPTRHTRRRSSARHGGSSGSVTESIHSMLFDEMHNKQQHGNDAAEGRQGIMSSSLDQHRLSWNQRINFGRGMTVVADPVESGASVRSDGAESNSGSLMFQPVRVAQGRNVSTDRLTRRDSGDSVDRPNRATNRETEAAGMREELALRRFEAPTMRNVRNVTRFQGTSMGTISRQTSVATNLSGTTTQQAALVAMLATINPFDWSVYTSSLYQERLTHNRRRWSHLFPTGRFDDEGHGVRVEDFDEEEENDRDMDTTGEGLNDAAAALQAGTAQDEEDDSVVPLTIESFRLNWKSLKSPGILPLTTDYYPERADLERNYRENFYSVTLPDNPGEYGYADHEDLIREMVGQRLSQDFQLLVDSSKHAGVEKGGHRGSGRGSKTDFSKLDGSSAASTLDCESASEGRRGSFDFPAEKATNSERVPPKGRSTGFAPIDPPGTGRAQEGAARSGTGGAGIGGSTAGGTGAGTGFGRSSFAITRGSSTATSSRLSNTLIIRPAARRAQPLDGDTTPGRRTSQRRLPLQSSQQPPRPPKTFGVQPNDPEASTSNDLIPEISAGELERKRVASVIAKGRGVALTYVLTMGHQIHKVEYTPATREVKVKRLVHHNFNGMKLNHWPYTYLLYDRAEKITSPVSLEFTDLVPFYNWNFLDMIVCGDEKMSSVNGPDIMDLTQIKRYRRNMFSILPTKPGSSPGRGGRRQWSRAYASSSDNVFTGTRHSTAPSSVPAAAAAAAAAAAVGTVGTAASAAAAAASSGSTNSGGADDVPVAAPPSRAARMRRFHTAAVGVMSSAMSELQGEDEAATSEGSGPALGTSLPTPPPPPPPSRSSSSSTAVPSNCADAASEVTEQGAMSDWEIQRIAYEEEERAVNGFKRFRDWLQSKVHNRKLEIAIHRRFQKVPRRREKEAEEQIARQEPGTQRAGAGAALSPLSPGDTEHGPAGGNSVAFDRQHPLETGSLKESSSAASPPAQAEAPANVSGPRKTAAQDGGEPGHKDTEEAGDEFELVCDDSVLDGIPWETDKGKVEIQSRDTGRYEWLVIQYDTAYSPYQSFHVEVQWIVAAGTSILNFCSAMSRKAKQAGLDFQQVPEYCRSTAAAYKDRRRVPHSFVLPKEIEFSVPLDVDEAFRELLLYTLQARLDFVMDSAFKQSRSELMWPTLVHKDGYAFLHFSRQGLEFLQNRLMATSTQSMQIHEVTLQTFRDTKDLCTTLDAAYQLVLDVVSAAVSEAEGRAQGGHDVT